MKHFHDSILKQKCFGEWDADSEQLEKKYKNDFRWLNEETVYKFKLYYSVCEKNPVFEPWN